jgi:hypothetical protein
MKLDIFLTNVPIRKGKGMNDIIQITNKHTKENEQNIIFSRKAFAPKKTNTSSNKDEDNESGKERVLFMVVEDSDEEGSEEEYEEEQVDYKEEFLSAIEVIKREKKKNKSLQVELKERGVKNSDSEELEQMITKLKIQVE